MEGVVARAPHHRALLRALTIALALKSYINISGDNYFMDLCKQIINLKSYRGLGRGHAIGMASLVVLKASLAHSTLKWTNFFEKTQLKSALNRFMVFGISD